MSINQVQGRLKPYTPPRDATGQVRPTIYFMYDHYFSAKEFRAKYPNAKFVSIGFLRGWTWHINAQGRILCLDAHFSCSLPNPAKPNIRIQYHDSKRSVPVPGMIPAPSTKETLSESCGGTYGYAFVISPQVEKSLDREFWKSRLKCSQEIMLIHPIPTPPYFQVQNAEAMFYTDVRNTSDLGRNLTVNPAESTKWGMGLREAIKSGIPKEYAHRVAGHVRGRRTDVEPIQATLRFPIPSQGAHSSNRQIQDAQQRRATELALKRAGAGHEAGPVRKRPRTDTAAGAARKDLEAHSAAKIKANDSSSS